MRICLPMLIGFALLFSAAPVHLTFCEESGPAESLKAKLEQPLSFLWESMTVGDALREVAREAGVKIALVDEDKARLPYRHLVHMTLYEVPAKDIIEMLCAMPGLRIEMKENALRILKPAAPAVEMEIYQIDDLLHVSRDVDASFGRMIQPSTSSVRDSVNNPFITNVGDPFLSTSNLADAIRAHVEPSSWDPATGTSIEERGGRLVVMQEPATQEKVRRLVAEFRAHVHRRLELDVRMIRIRSSDLELVIRDARSRGNPVGLLDDEAVQRLGELIDQGSAKSLYAGTTCLGTTQGGVLRQARERRFMYSYGEDNGRPEPLVTNVLLGTSIWIRPWLSADDQQLRLSLAAEWQELAGEPKPFKVLRGGLIVSQDANTKVIVKRKPTKGAGARPAPGREQPDEEKVDVSDEYEFEIEEQQPIRMVTEDLHVYLPSLARSRVRLDVEVPVDTFSYVTIPASSKSGPLADYEVLLMVRGHPVTTPCPPLRVKPPAYSPQLQAKLATEIELTLKDVKLNQALIEFGDKSGVSVAIDYGRIRGAAEKRVSWSGRNKASIILSEILRQGECEAQTFGSVLLVAPARSPYQMRIYDVRGLAYSFMNGYLSECPLGFQGGCGVRFVPPQGRAGLSAPDMAQLIRERLMPAQFMDGRSSIEEQGGRMIVVQTPEHHLQIVKHLQAMRRKALQPVQLTARWLTVDASIVEKTPLSLDASATKRFLRVFDHPGTRVVGGTRLNVYPGQKVCAFGGMLKPQVADQTLSGTTYVPRLRFVPAGTGFEFRIAAQSESHLEGAVETITVDTRACLNAFGPPAPQQDPLQQQETQREPSPEVAAMPGAIHSGAGCGMEFDTTLRIHDGGAALLRYSLPEWLPGESEEPAERAKRLLLLLVQAERRR